MLSRNAIALIVISLAHFIVDFYGGMVAPLQKPTLMEHLGTDLASVAFLVGLFGLAVNIIQPAMGFLLGEREMPLLLVLAPLGAAAIVLISLSHDYNAAIAFILVASVGIGVFHPEAMLAAHAYSGKRENLGVPIFISLGFFGTSAGACLSGWWAHNYQMSGLYLLAIPAVVMTVLLFAFGLHKPKGHASIARNESICHGRSFWLVLLLGIMSSTAATFFFNLLPVVFVEQYSRESGAQAWAGKALLVLGLSGAVGSYFWGWLANHRSRFKLCSIGMALGLLPFWLLLQNIDAKADFVLLLGLIAIFGLTANSIFPLIIIMARGAEGMTLRLRAGIIMGGSWGLGSVFYMAASPWLRSPGEGLPPACSALDIFRYMIPAALVTGALAAAWLGRRARAVNQPA